MKEQIEREKIVFDYFISNPTAYIQEISIATGIPKSSVQRYLKKFSGYVLDTGLTIAEQLKVNQLEGKKKGGLTYFQNNTATKNEKGQFTGSKATPTEMDKPGARIQNIRFLCEYYIDRYPITIQEMADDLESIGLFTKDYIYRCITATDLAQIVGEDTAEEVEARLDSAKYSFDRKIGGKNQEVEDDDWDLTPGEAMVIGLRKGNHSQEQTAKILGVSRQTVQNWESSAIEKIKDKHK